MSKDLVDDLCASISAFDIPAPLIYEQARDVLFNLSGFANSRCIDDREVDVLLINDDDWPEEHLVHEAEQLLGTTTSIHKSYFTHNCQLSQIGELYILNTSCFRDIDLAQVVSFFGSPEAHPPYPLEPPTNLQKNFPFGVDYSLKTFR